MSEPEFPPKEQDDSANANLIAPADDGTDDADTTQSETSHDADVDAGFDDEDGS